MDYNDLTDEQKAKVKECKTAEDMLALAKEEGYELTEEQIEAVSGGGWAVCTDRTSFHMI